MRHARSEPLEWPIGNQFGSGPHTENHKEACSFLPTGHPVPGSLSWEPAQRLISTQATQWTWSRTEGAEGPGPDDLTLFTAVSTGAGLWPGPSPRTRLSSYLCTPKNRGGASSGPPDCVHPHPHTDTRLRCCLPTITPGCPGASVRPAFTLHRTCVLSGEL